MNLRPLGPERVLIQRRKAQESLNFRSFYAVSGDWQEFAFRRIKARFSRGFAEVLRQKRKPIFAKHTQAEVSSKIAAHGTSEISSGVSYPSMSDRIPILDGVVEAGIVRMRAAIGNSASESYRRRNACLRPILCRFAVLQSRAALGA